MAIEHAGGLLVAIECSNMLSIRIVESGKVWDLLVPTNLACIRPYYLS